MNTVLDGISILVKTRLIPRVSDLAMSIFGLLGGTALCIDIIDWPRRNKNNKIIKRNSKYC